MKTTIKIVAIAIMGFNFITTAQEYVPKTGGTFTGNVSFSDNASLLTNRIDDTGSSSDNAVRLVAHWWPQDTGLRNLGSELLRWRNLWISKNGFFGSGIGVGTDVIEHTMQLGNAVENVSLSLRGPDGNDLSSYIAFEDNQGLTKQWFRFINNTKNNQLKISSYEVENLMTFTRTNGYVGIGTATPSAKLTVKGKIHAEEVKVYSPVAPDYVFQKYYEGKSTLKPDYKMPTLQEVEFYAKENHHLPEIPSAKELEKEGLQVGNMINKLLQKIEELTLYTIEQEKRLNEQQKEIEKLKNKK